MSKEGKALLSFTYFIFGFIIGLPALRLKGDYLAIATLAFGEIVRNIFKNLKTFGGAKGMSTKIYDSDSLFIIAFVVLLFVLFCCQSLINSKHGRAVIAIRDNEIAAKAMGINVTYYKLLIFIIAAFFAGIAGVLYGETIGTIRQEIFSYNYSIEILVMVVLGGMGSMLGSVVSATVLTILPEALRAFADYRMIAYAVVLILTMIFRPQGLMGRYDFSLGNVIEHLMNGELPWARRKADKEADANA